MLKLKNHSVVSDSLQPHGSQHARPPCPSPPNEANMVTRIITHGYVREGRKVTFIETLECKLNEHTVNHSFLNVTNALYPG